MGFTEALEADDPQPPMVVTTASPRKAQHDAPGRAANEPHDNGLGTYLPGS
jgi:hypothetical protein